MSISRRLLRCLGPSHVFGHCDSPMIMSRSFHTFDGEGGINTCIKSIFVHLACTIRPFCSFLSLLFFFLSTTFFSFCGLVWPCFSGWFIFHAILLQGTWSIYFFSLVMNFSIIWDWSKCFCHSMSFFFFFSFLIKFIIFVFLFK